MPEAVMRLNAYNRALAEGLPPPPITGKPASGGGAGGMMGGGLLNPLLDNAALTKPHREL